MLDFYREFILDHYRHPRNKGKLPNADISHEEHNPVCGDRIHMDIKLEDDHIADIKWDGEGCTISQASASILSEMVKGKSIEEVRQLSKEDLLEQLGMETLTPARIKCALLSLKVLKAGLYGLTTWPGEEDEWN
ncbi:nitrogen fixation protein NifU and related proteins [Ardenticatena maritima]|uniref:Fe-S cluster protein n=1 Tax=Ardenticatena maritima TaxID=872965 RepID=A0A0M9UDX8_9CHLR|nr:SUF system NifU family Fe-S cluster assembly protein [Ardenticatena maritima]KPL88342.1 Fe-S cluster protein [Ardenticatena maritima]GAP64494.1 nitrogen fixation protein NifU and related proteins [Ardenticatena maritima]